MNGSEDDVKDGKAMLIVNCCSYVWRQRSQEELMYPYRTVLLTKI
jgi:hypothetical protein